MAYVLCLGNVADVRYITITQLSLISPHYISNALLIMRTEVSNLRLHMCPATEIIMASEAALTFSLGKRPW